MKPTRHSLIWRIALMVVAVEAVALGALGMLDASQFSRSIELQTNARIERIGRMLQSGQLPVTAVGDRDLLGGLIGAPYLNGAVIGGNGLVVVSTDDGLLGHRAADVAGVDPRWLGADAPARIVVRGRDTLTEVMRLGSGDGAAPAYVVVATISTAGIAATQRRIALLGLAVSLLFVVASSLGIVLVAQRLITRRVRASLDVLRRAEEGDLSVRIGAPAADELGALQGGIDSMIAKVGALLQTQRAAAVELAAQKSLLESVIQAAPMRVFWKDRELRYIGCNALFARDAGFADSDGLVGKTDFEMPWREQALLYRADDLAVLRSGGSKLEFEEPQTTPDGRDIWLSTSKVPLRGEAGELVGVLGVYTDITDRKHAAEEIRRLAYYDSLTGLPNRAFFADRLQRAMRTGSSSGQYSVLFILDLDNFKDLNDSQGHDVGDQLLVSVAHRLLERVRMTDDLARLGGDEYVVIAEAVGRDLAGATVEAGRVAEELRLALLQPHALEDGRLLHYTSASIGAALFLGDQLPASTLLKQADLALYQSKNAGRNAVRFFDATMQTAIEERSRMAAALRRGLDRGELRLFLQPQVDAEGRLIGAEALTRWFTADGGQVSPAVFIPLAEDTGMIQEIGAWVLEQACRQLADWRCDAATRDLVLAINVSAHQFRQPDLVEQVDARIRAHGIDPTRLKLEITESAVLGDVGGAAEVMERLKALGVSFALDDFGTGYASLTYVRRLPLDQIKIDQSFVRDVTRDPSDAAIVRAIIAMGRSLGLAVIAEGVETEEQSAFLRHHGCGQFQGYLFGRPAPVQDWNPALFTASGSRETG